MVIRRLLKEAILDFPVFMLWDTELLKLLTSYMSEQIVF